MTTNSNLIEFAEFVIDETGDSDLPDYKTMDLMKISRLVSNIWVYDFRDGVNNGVRFHFSGTKVDEQFGMNVMGHRIEDIYVAEDKEALLEGSHYKVYLEKKVGYTHRNVNYKTIKGDRITHVETLMFPCSSDNENVDFGLGLVEYKYSDTSVVNTYVLL